MGGLLLVYPHIPPYTHVIVVSTAIGNQIFIWRPSAMTIENKTSDTDVTLTSPECADMNESSKTCHSCIIFLSSSLYSQEMLGDDPISISSRLAPPEAFGSDSEGASGLAGVGQEWSKQNIYLNCQIRIIYESFMNHL